MNQSFLGVLMGFAIRFSMEVFSRGHVVGPQVRLIFYGLGNMMCADALAFLVWGLKVQAVGQGFLDSGGQGVLPPFLPHYNRNCPCWQ